VLANLKADGWDPASISNGRKCELGERLRRATGLSLRSITGFLRISKGSYEYHRTQLGRPTRRDEVAPEMEHGYRFVREELRGRDGALARRWCATSCARELYSLTQESTVGVVPEVRTKR
jgi:hypothetical protein